MQHHLSTALFSFGFVLATLAGLVNGQTTADRGGTRAENCRSTTASERVDLSATPEFSFTERRDVDITEFRLGFRIERDPQVSGPAVSVKIFSEQSGVLLWSFISGDVVSDRVWTSELDPKGVRITVKLETTGNPSPQATGRPRVIFDSAIVCEPPPKPQSVFFNKFYPIGSEDEKTQKVGRSIARLSIVADNGIPIYCTGFLVSHDLILTNRHCVYSGKEAYSTTASFDFDSKTSKILKIGISDLLIASSDLDFVILRLKESACATANCSGDLDRKPISLRGAVDPAANGRLLIIQHPNGMSKQVARFECIANRIGLPGNSTSRTDFGNQCDTSPGSSGAPVFIRDAADIPTNLAGIHHLGIRSIAVGPVVLKVDQINRAVSARQIWAYIAKERPEVAAEVQ